MNKRALLLTAATVALLSGQAWAATDTITTKVTTPLKTSTAGTGSMPADIDFTDTTSGSSTTYGALDLSSPSGTPPAIEINSSNTVRLEYTANTITYKNVTSAVGVQMEQGNTGEFFSVGAIDLTGSGTGKIGVVIGDSTLTAGTFTGINDADNTGINDSDPSGRTTVLDLQPGSVINILGDGSTGVELAAGNTAAGDLLFDGALTVTGSTSSGAAVTDILIGSSTAVNGNITLGNGAAISAIGDGAQGLEILGTVSGSVTNAGTLEVSGASTLSSTKTNPSAGSALIISNSVAGGIVNFGPSSATDTTTSATISVSGSAPAVEIEPGYASTTEVPITIGGYADTGGDGTVSFLNRGVIHAAAANPNSTATAMLIGGASATYDVTFQNKFVNAGTISASTTTTTAGNSSTTQAFGLDIGSYVNIANGIFNKTESNSTATISAVVNGDAPASAHALIIGTESSVPSLDNSGEIYAAVTSSDTQITGSAGASPLAAWAILDESGTLTSLTNESGGEIIATASALDDNMQIARAIDLEYATSNITINNQGEIIGDVFTGTGNDQISVSGTSAQPASIIGNIYFGGGPDTLAIGNFATVTGALIESNNGTLNITVGPGGVLTETNTGVAQSVLENAGSYQAIGAALPAAYKPNVRVSSLDVQGGQLGITLADYFDYASHPTTAAPIIQGVGNSSTIDLESGSTLKINFGSFVSSTGTAPAQFILFDAPTSGAVTIADQSVKQQIESAIPFLFSYQICTYNVTGMSGDTNCSTTNPAGSGHSDVVLNLTNKTASEIGLTGYAAKMYDFANAALVNDNVLGAAVITAGAGVTAQAQGQAIYQKIYSQFAPDVTGSTRAIAISLTDSSSGPVAARQRALRMYANQDGDLTLWGQEFAQDLTVSTSTEAAGYRDTGFGFVLGADGGDPGNGRYGAAFTFYSGDTTERPPVLSRTDSEWYTLTGYSDWRGKQMFFDSQISAGYAAIKGKRRIAIYSDDDTSTLLASRTASNSHAAEFLAGSISTGFIFHTGGTSLTPQIDLDGLTMRQENYSESNNHLTTAADDGFDLAVKQNYTSSLRAFAGLDLRQDLRFDGFYFQPEARAGYRYDFLDGVDKVTAAFVSNPTDTFSISGPDPSRGNLVLGGGMAVTTGAWSIGLNYDYKRGIGGTGGTDQVGTLTLLGRI